MKYEFTGETKVVNGITVRRIKRLSDGLIGGWIEKEDNLSHKGDCFVYDEAVVFGYAQVCGYARVFGDALVGGNARVYGNAEVSGYAHVSGNAKVYGYAEVFGYAQVFGDVRVCDCAWVYGNAQVCDCAHVSGYAKVSGYAQVSGNAKVYGYAQVFGDAQVYGNARVFGDAIIGVGIISTGKHVGTNITPAVYNSQVKLQPSAITCTCDMFTVMNYGCKCGGFQREKEAENEQTHK